MDEAVQPVALGGQVSWWKRGGREIGDAAVLVVEPGTTWMQSSVLKKLRHTLVALPEYETDFFWCST